MALVWTFKSLGLWCPDPGRERFTISNPSHDSPWRIDRLPSSVFLGFPGGSDCKESICSAGDLGSIPGLGRCPGGGCGNPLQYSCLENPHGQRSLAGYSPQGRKELDMTEQLSTAQHMRGWLTHSIAILRSLVPVLHSPWHLHFTCLIPS